MPVTTLPATGARHPVPSQQTKVLRRPAPATPATKPTVEPATTQGTEPSSPPVEPNAPNLQCSDADAGLSQPAPKTPGPRSGNARELLARYRAENPEDKHEDKHEDEAASVFKDVVFDLSPPPGTTWEQIRQEMFGHDPATPPSAPAAPARDELPPTMNRRAAPDGRTPASHTRQEPSGTGATAPPPSGTSGAHEGVDFDLDNDPGLVGELRALNDKYAPPQAKAEAASARQGSATAWKAGVFARTRSASQGDVPRPTPAEAGRDLPATHPSKKEGGLREKLKRWWSEPGARVGRSKT